MQNRKKHVQFRALSDFRKFPLDFIQQRRTKKKSGGQRQNERRKETRRKATPLWVNHAQKVKACRKKVNNSHQERV